MTKRKSKFLGFSFPDEVARVTFKTGHFKKGKENEWKDSLLPNFDPGMENTQEGSFWRVTFFISLTAILFFLVFLRLFHLQIVEGKKNRELADGNRIQIKLIHAPRGVIYDRNGKVLAFNSPGFRLIDPITKKANLISRDEALALEVNNDPRAANLEVDNIRSYPKGPETAQVIGYMGEISEEQLNDPDFSGYKIGDRVGQSGLEQYYEKALRGVDGGEVVEVDAQGRKLRTLRRIPPIPGNNIYLTIDSDLQNRAYQEVKKAADQVKSCCAAVVAEDPNSGQVLAMVSLPSFDSNIFTSKYDSKAIGEVFSNTHSPVINRAIAGSYPPGSTFKIITSLAGLATGKITSQTQLEDTGVIYLGPFSYSNWYFTQYGKKEGLINLVTALQRSNDVFFYRVGQIIGENALENWAKKLWLGQRSGIDLPGEVSGLIANNDWKVKNTGQPWYPGDTLHMAIGQGFTLTTPLQILGSTAFVADGGILYKPQLLYKVTDKDGNLIKEFKPEVLTRGVFTKEQIDLVRKGLEQVTSDRGTAWPFFTFTIKTAGKTGTAEYGDPGNRTHAWYTSYGPTDNPSIAMTVLIEGGGEGSNVAAPVAKEVYRWYFSTDKNHLIKDKWEAATDSAKTSTDSGRISE